MALLAGEFSSVLQVKKLSITRCTGRLIHYQWRARLSGNRHLLNDTFKSGIESYPWSMKHLHSCAQEPDLQVVIKLTFLYTTPTWKMHNWKCHLLSGHYLVDREALVTFCHSHNEFHAADEPYLMSVELQNSNIRVEDCGQMSTTVSAMDCCSSLFCIM